MTNKSDFHILLLINYRTKSTTAQFNSTVFNYMYSLKEYNVSIEYLFALCKALATFLISALVVANPYISYALCLRLG